MSVSLAGEQAAELASISERHLKRLAHGDDPPPQSADGKYPCQPYGEWLRARALRGIGVTADGIVYDYEKERARLTKAQADKTELEVEVLRGKLIPSELVETVWSGMTAAARSRLLALPYRLAQLAQAAQSFSEIESAASDLVTEALHELSGYSPDQYAARAVRSSEEGDDSGVDVAAATKADGQSVGGRRKATQPRGKRRTGPVED